MIYGGNDVGEDEPQHRSWNGVVEEEDSQSMFLRPSNNSGSCNDDDSIIEPSMIFSWSASCDSYECYSKKDFISNVSFSSITFYFTWDVHY